MSRQLAFVGVILALSGVEAIANLTSYSRLVRALGEPAPGPAGLLLSPSPRRLLDTPY